MSRPSNKTILFALVTLLAMTMACGESASATAQPPADTVPTESPAVEATEIPPTEAATEELPAAPLGSSPENPIPLTETLVTPEWEIQVLQYLRGGEAMTILEQASPFNKPHEDPNMEYALVNLRVKYVGTNPSAHVYGKMFRSLGSAGEIYDAVSFIDVEVPAPELEADLAPGGEAEGWVAIQIGKDETGVMLVLWPYVSYENDTAIFDDSTLKWYIALE
ncbi:MAG: hypothetical protein DPW18_17430 [Chloroflexi bacterium]|nr:hypothetical protein [Chloroflexota bacterium]MDL1943295.1 DUF4352 domain-containing protein [Chloroflexi bacterium CFX2]